MTDKIISFDSKKIRRTRHENQWWFLVIDVVEVLTESSRPRKYWADLKVRLQLEEGFIQLSEKIGQLKLIANDGNVAKNARLGAEKELGETVISKNNFLGNSKKKTIKKN